MWWTNGLNHIEVDISIHILIVLPFQTPTTKNTKTVRYPYGNLKHIKDGRIKLHILQPRGHGPSGTSSGSGGMEIWKFVTSRVYCSWWPLLSQGDRVTIKSLRRNRTWFGRSTHKRIWVTLRIFPQVKVETKQIETTTYKWQLYIVRVYFTI